MTVVKTKQKLYFPDYATKSNLKNATGVVTSEFAKRTDFPNADSDADELDIDKLKNVPSGLSSLKSKVDKLDIGKLETTPVDLRKLSDVVKNDVVEKTDYYEFVKKINAIKTIDKSDLVKKADYNTKIGEAEKKLYHDHDKSISTQ